MWRLARAYLGRDRMDWRREVKLPKEAQAVRELTDRQQDVLDAIKVHLRRHGVPPSRTELAHSLGLAEASSVTGHLARLADAGWIELMPNTNRGIRVLNENLPLLGTLAEVAAGTPMVCDAHIVERIPAAIAGLFQPRPDFLLTVRGDSMEKAGIKAGDVIAVHKTPDAKSGQIVVARFGDEVTVKRYVRIDERRIELRPESGNDAHEPMRLDLAMHILQIEGIVVGALIRGLDDDESTTRRKSNQK